MDVFALATEDTERNARQNEYNWYNVAPAEMYPAMVQFIQERIKEGDSGDGIIRSQYYPAAVALSSKAWPLALKPRDEVTRQADIDLRAQALELARVWFTELLHRALRWKAAGVESPILWPTEPPAAVAAPLGLRIEKDATWRL